MTPTPRLVRFVVTVQRRPLFATVVVYAALTASGLVLRLVKSDQQAWGWATVAVVASTSFAELGSRITSTWGRIAVVGVGIGATLPFARIVFPFPNEWIWFFMVSAALVAVPHITVACANRIPVLSSRAAFGVAWILTTAALAGMASRMVKRPSGLAIFLGWSVALQLTVHAAAAMPRRLAVGVPVAAAAGLACGLVVGSFDPEDGSAYVLPQCIAWTLGALLVHVAAIGRSMTAVPDEHPIRADFGRR